MDTAPPSHRRLYEALKRRAREGYPVSYSELEPETGIHQQSMTSPLREISMHQHKLGRPLLSAIVVRKGKKYPSGGFYTMAIEEAKRLPPGSDQAAKEAFACAEQKAVFKWWREHPDSE